MRRGVDFAQAELATKIRGKYLRALEDEQFELLPAETYVKGFLRNYAEYLGLDGQLYVDEFNSRFVSGEEHEPRARRSAARPQRHTRRLETSVVLGAIAVITVLTVIVISAWKSAGDKPRTPTRAAPAVEGAAGDPAALPRHRACAVRPTSPSARLGERGRSVRRHARRSAMRRSRSAAAAGCGCRSTRPRTCGSRCAESRCTCPHLGACRQDRHGDRLAPAVARAAIVASGSELVRGDRNDRNGPYLASSPPAPRHRPRAHHRRRRRAGRSPGGARGRALVRPALHLGRARTDARRPHDRAAGGGRRRRAARRRGAARGIEELSRRVATRLGRPYTDFADGVTKQATLPDGALWVGLVGYCAGRRARGGRDCVAVALPGPPRELQAAVAAGARDRAAPPAARAVAPARSAPCSGSTASRSPPSRSRSPPQAVTATGST